MPYGFSPNGDWLLVGDRAVLKKVPVEGGPAVTIADDLTGGVAWGPGDVIVAGSTNGLWAGSAAGGDLSRLVAPAAGDNGEFIVPRFLPNGRAVLFHILNDSMDAAQVAVYDFETKQHRVLLPGASPQFATSGHLIFYRSGSLWAVPFDPDSLNVRGEPRAVLERVGANQRGLAYYRLARNGTLVYRAEGVLERVALRTLVWVDREGREQPLPEPPANYDWPRVSPDGRSVAVTIHDVNTDVWILELAPGEPRAGSRPALAVTGRPCGHKTVGEWCSGRAGKADPGPFSRNVPMGRDPWTGSSREEDRAASRQRVGRQKGVSCLPINQPMATLTSAWWRRRARRAGNRWCRRRRTRRDRPFHLAANGSPLPRTRPANPKSTWRDSLSSTTSAHSREREGVTRRGPTTGGNCFTSRATGG